MVSKAGWPVGRDTQWLNSLVQQVDIVCQLVARPGGVVCATDVMFPSETRPDRTSWLALGAAIDELARRHRLLLTVNQVADGILVTIGVPPQPAALPQPAREQSSGLRRFFSSVRRHGRPE